MGRKAKGTGTNIVAVERSLRILEVLYAHDRDMGVNEIAEYMGEYQSTVHRAISTLESHGYISQNKETSKYSLGIKLYMLGQSVEKNSAIVKAIEPHTKALANELNETVSVAMRDYSKDDTIYGITIIQVKGKGRVIEVSEGLGESWQCANSALGKVILAYSKDISEKELREVELVEYTEKSIKTYEQLVSELQTIRNQGYAVDDEERERGLFCVSCPIIGKNDEQLFAISVSGFIEHMKSLGVNYLKEKLSVTCDEIRKSLM